MTTTLHVPAPVVPNGHHNPEHPCCATAEDKDRYIAELEAKVAELSATLNAQEKQTRKRGSLQAQLRRREGITAADKLYVTALINVYTDAKRRGKTKPGGWVEIFQTSAGTNANGEPYESMQKQTALSPSTLSRCIRTWTQKVPLFERNTDKREITTYENGRPRQRLWIRATQDTADALLQAAVSLPIAPPEPKPAKKRIRCAEHPRARMRHTRDAQCVVCLRHAEGFPRITELDPWADVIGQEQPVQEYAGVAF